MKQSRIEFDKDVTGLTNMAIFIAQLVREGVTFEVEQRVDQYIVELTGGF